MHIDTTENKGGGYHRLDVLTEAVVLFVHPRLEVMITIKMSNFYVRGLSDQCEFPFAGRRKVRSFLGNDLKLHILCTASIHQNKNLTAV